MKLLAKGIYPTMLAAYTKDNKIDYRAMEQLLEWYLAKGVQGIYALCHSTEIHWLTFEERLELARFVIKTVRGRAAVVVSGNVESDINRQIYEANRLIELGPDAIAFVRNRVDSGSGRSFQSGIEEILAGIPEGITLGMYECPYPYRKYLSLEEMKFLIATGRFGFLKDTICDKEVMRARQKLVQGTPFQLYNANSATLLESLRFGYDGYCGVMANFHPELYVWLYEHQGESRADAIGHYLGAASLIEGRCYPICAKRYLKRYERIQISDFCRSVPDETVPALWDELEDLYVMAQAALRMTESENCLISSEPC